MERRDRSHPRGTAETELKEGVSAPGTPQAGWEEAQRWRWPGHLISPAGADEARGAKGRSLYTPCWQRGVMRQETRSPPVAGSFLGAELRY